MNRRKRIIRDQQKRASERRVRRARENQERLAKRLLEMFGEIIAETDSVIEFRASQTKAERFRKWLGL